MFNYSGSSDFVLERLMNEANEKLHSNKLKIISEKTKIKHAENLLSQLKENLREQNKDLIIFIQKENELEEELSKFTDCTLSREVYNQHASFSINKNENNSQNVNFERTSMKRKFPEVIEDSDKIPPENSNKVTISDGINQQRKNPETFHNDSKVTKISSPVYSGDGSTGASALPSDEILIEEIEVNALEGVMISAITARYDFGIFFGGVNGILIRYFNNQEHIYKTNVVDTFKRIEIMFKGQRPILVAFTHKNIYIYENIMDEKFTKKLYLSENKDIFNDGSSFYITMKSGIIKTLNKADWNVCDYLDNDYFKDGIFHPCTINKEYFLVSLKDKLLYKTQNKNLTDLCIIEGIEGVLKVIQMREFGYICYSEDDIWFLNKDFELSGTMPFKNRVKFIKCTFFHAVVVDFFHTVHVYPLLKECNFGEKILEKQFFVEGLISAVDVTSDAIYVASRKGLHTISPYCKFTEEIDRFEEGISKSTGYIFSRKIKPNEQRIKLKIKHPEVINQISSKTLGDVDGNSALPKVEMIFKRMELKSIKNTIISTFQCKWEFGIFIGGFQGFLMRYYLNEEHVYNIKVNETIIQIEITVRNKVPTLIAFTNKQVFVFEDVTSNIPSKKIYLPGMNAIFNEGTIFYITLDVGTIKTMNSANWRIQDYRQNDYSKEGIFFPCSAMSKYFLISSLKDKCLYKTKNKNFSNLQIIEGVEDVTKSLRINGIGFILYNLNVIYLLNQNFELLGNVRFENKIEILHFTFNHGVVVDSMNFIYVYLVRRESNISEKIFEKQIERKITGLLVTETTVYVATGDVILTLNLT